MRRGVKAVAAAGALLAAVGVGVAFWVDRMQRVSMQTRSGGMIVDLTRLGKLAPAAEKKGMSIDPVPVVLWSKHGPSAVLAYRKDRDLAGLRMKQDFVDLGPWSGNGVEYHFAIPPDIQSDLALDAVEVGGTAAGDVNGDGQDELVRVRTFGLVEVFQRGKAVQALVGLNPAPLEVRYEHWRTEKVRLPGRDMLLMLFRRNVLGEVPPARLTQLGAAEPYAVVRIDQRGAARVKLQGLEKVEEVLAVGAVNRPGSQEVDELLAVSRVGRKAVLSRHRLDGAAIGGPREIYEPFDVDGAMTRFCFVAQSDRAVLLDPKQRVYFVAAAKPVNWVRSVELQPIVSGSSGELRWLGTVGTGAELAAVVNVDASVYAVDEEGKYWGWQGGRWGRLAQRGPMIEVTGPELHQLAGIYSAGGAADELLTVHVHHRGTRPLTEDEIDAAGKRYLPDDDYQELRRSRTVDLVVGKQVWGAQMDAERAAAGEKGEITTAEEWKRLAPKSYAEAEHLQRNHYWSTVDVLLLAGLEHGGRAPTSFKEPVAYEAWLRGLTVPASTSFTLLRRGERVASFRIEGVPLKPGPEEVPGERVQFRASAGEVNVVLPLAGPPESPFAGGFYLVHARTEAHR